METGPDKKLLVEMEARAAEMARDAGKILKGHFGGHLDVEYKGKGKRDPVTSADKESQSYLCETISRLFPGHGIVAEEGPEEGDAALPDLTWVLDPLDGTTNYLNGLPIYAVSIAVLHRGEPIAGALYVPWPGQNGGIVLQAHRGGGARLDGQPLSIPQAEGLETSRLVGLPGSFGARFRLGKGMRGRVGEPRVTGSIAYEMALTACGVMQYAVFGGPRVWDVAAGALVVVEAGGTVLIRRRRRWEPLGVLGPSWEAGSPSYKDMRGWAASLIAGDAQAATLVAASLRARAGLIASVGRLLRMVQSRQP